MKKAARILAWAVVAALLMYAAGPMVLDQLTSRAQRPPVNPPGGRPPVDSGSGSSDSGGGSGRARPISDIFGAVTDTCLNRPGAGIEILVNGEIVRTDWDGRYSITGLNAGDYAVSLALPGEWQPVQGSQTVTLDGVNDATVDLSYCSTPLLSTAVVTTAEDEPPLTLPETGLLPPPLAMQARAALCAGVYVVAPGDTPASLFKLFYNDDPARLVAATTLARVENRAFANLAGGEASPGSWLCIP